MAPVEEGKSSVLVVGHRKFLFSLKFSFGFLGDRGDGLLSATDRVLRTVD